MTANPWVLLGLLVLSTTLTLSANWLVSGRQPPSIPHRLSTSGIIALGASVLWIILILCAGIVALRYIERVEHTTIGYLCFVLVAGVLSWIRAILFRRLQSQEKGSPVDTDNQKSHLVRVANYVLFAIVVYLLVAWGLRRSVEPVLFMPLCLGALIPDLDSPISAIGGLLPALSRRLQARFGQQQGWHSLAAAAVFAAITSPLLLFLELKFWAFLPFGFLSHILLDLFTPQGVMLLWPLNRTCYSLSGKAVPDRDPASSRKVLATLGILALILLLAVDIGAPPAAPAPSLSYEQTLQRYYSLRGNYLVYATIEGMWQASGRRMNGTFEILSAAGESYVLLDRYTGNVFSAGRSSDDNLYLNRISLQTGSAVSIKPVELHLHDQLLADALPVLYEMQREPGLQHIYVSGDIIIASNPEPGMPALQQDYAQTSLRRIQAHEARHFSLHYLTAGDLIALASIPVETANLIFVASSATPPSGPTATPLPTVSVTNQPGS